MQYFIVLSDRIILTPETIEHGERVILGPYATREAAEADVDAKRKALKRDDPRKYKRMSPISGA